MSTSTAKAVEIIVIDDSPERTPAAAMGTENSMLSPPPSILPTPSSSSAKTPVVNPYQTGSSRKKKVINNPYTAVDQDGKRKFIGGSEQARRNAQNKKKKGTPITTPIEQERFNEELPRHMNSLERFYAALLRSEPKQFLDAANQQSKAWLSLWETICHRVGLQPFHKPLLPTYEDPKLHFDLRTALILEEARNAISTELERVWKNNGRQNNKAKTMYLRAQLVEMIPTSQHSKITFLNHKDFTKDQLFDIRPGTVFQCIPRDRDMSIHNVTLGVVTTGNREELEKHRRFQILVLRNLPPYSEDVDWVVLPITTLITELRCFEALTSSVVARVGFINSILGGKTSRHTRFDSDGEVAENSKTDNKENSILNYFKKDDSDGKSVMFKLPRLNPTQEKAASTFLNAEPNSVTLIQGPPGTGKTTLLVSIICRYFIRASRTETRPKLLVCAPTNKAVTVLAGRFLKAMNQDRCPCNVLLVGDADKLLADSNKSYNKKNNQRPPPDVIEEERTMESIFLFTWIQSIIRGFQKIQSYFVPGSGARGLSTEDLYIMSQRLSKRLSSSLQGLPDDITKLTHKLNDHLKTIKFGGRGDSVGVVLEMLVKALKSFEKESIWNRLVTSADIIFCTLAAAGGSVFRQARFQVTDLIVDEAAAATEPQLYIPFHLRPSRLLAVGDPLQLPATVLSRYATERGLTKSLHERLMYDCNFEHIILDVQYRMNPSISVFPSQRFYENKIADGDNVTSASYKNGPCLKNCQPYTFLQVSGMEEAVSGGSHRNMAEVKVVIELIQQLRALKESSDPQWFSSDRIRVITFYQAQVTAITNALMKEGLAKKLMVATVDSSQGCEADIVIVSFVRSPPNSKTVLMKQDAGFLTDDRRMNVALTRARYQLFCVGNASALGRMQGAETLLQLVGDAQKRGVVEVQGRHHTNAQLEMFYG